MPGFVDVSNMSDLEIKHLGQMDDDYRKTYRNPYSYRKPVNRVPKVTFTHNTDDVFAASWQAYITNGKQYIKALGPNKTNRTVVEELLSDPTSITQESRESGDKMRNYFKGLTFKMIEGKKLSDFMQGAYNAATKDEITSNFDFSVIISLPTTYERSVVRDTGESRIKWASGGFIGSIGDHVDVSVEIVKQLWSQNWNVWYATGITDKDQVVFFSTKTQLEIGKTYKIKGTVKSHRDASTQLNRVKIL